MPKRFLSALLTLCALSLAAFSPVQAQNRDVPYWAVVNTEELNMRVGPSMEYKIKWVYRRKGLPVKVIRVVEGWRLIEDYEGDRGWVNSGLLAKETGGIVVGNGLAAMRDAPADNAKLKWNAEPGVVGRIKGCEAGWCRFDVDGRAGWVKASRLWGAGEA